MKINIIDEHSVGGTDVDLDEPSEFYMVMAIATALIQKAIENRREIHIKKITVNCDLVPLTSCGGIQATLVDGKKVVVHRAEDNQVPMQNPETQPSGDV